MNLPYVGQRARLRALVIFTGMALALPLSALLGARPLAAQPAEASPASAEVQALSAALRADQTAHLWRVGVWGAANVATGLALFALADAEARPGRRGFGMQSAAWGAVNVGIAAVGLLSGPGETVDAWPLALRAENGYADVLLVNLGLNVGYSAVGATLVIVAGRGVSNPDAWRGHGSALVVQGAGLFVLDGIAYLASRGRMDALVGLVQQVALVPSAEGVGLVLRF